MAEPERISFEELQDKINEALLNEDMPDNLYKSVNGLSKIVEAIVKTDGKNWAKDVLNDDGTPLLNPDEQKQFTELFAPYISTIIHFVNPDSFQDKTVDLDSQEGGEFDPIAASGLSELSYKRKLNSVKGKASNSKGIDEYYNKLIKKVVDYDNVVKSFASQHGITRIEKEHDLEEDIPAVPKIAKSVISTVALSTSGVPPMVTRAALDRVKVPFRFIVFMIYILLDIARLSFGILNVGFMRKFLSILVSVIEILRGDWKKALMTFIGYFGKYPMLFGQVGKIFIFIFQLLDPQLQMELMYMPLDITKSLIIGFLLSVFQVTAPEEIRLPVIGALENIAKLKEDLDEKLIEAGMSARPDFYTITYEDINNIQAIISDDTKVCSKEFQDAIGVLKDITILRIILQLLRVPLDDETIKRRCGEIKPYAKELVKEQNILEKRGLVDEPAIDESPEETTEESPKKMIEGEIESAKEKLKGRLGKLKGKFKSLKKGGNQRVLRYKTRRNITSS